MSTESSVRTPVTAGHDVLSGKVPTGAPFGA
jgi:hypothetical protein